MPGDMDGLALVEMVREERPEVGLLVTSGLPDHGTIPPPARFLPKPYTAQQLMTTIRELAIPPGQPADR